MQLDINSLSLNTNALTHFVLTSSDKEKVAKAVVCAILDTLDREGGADIEYPEHLAYQIVNYKLGIFPNKRCAFALTDTSQGDHWTVQDFSDSVYADAAKVFPILLKCREYATQLIKFIMLVNIQGALDEFLRNANTLRDGDNPIITMKQVIAEAITAHVMCESIKIYPFQSIATIELVESILLEAFHSVPTSADLALSDEPSVVEHIEASVDYMLAERNRLHRLPSVNYTAIIQALEQCKTEQAQRSILNRAVSSVSRVV